MLVQPQEPMSEVWAQQHDLTGGSNHFSPVSKYMANTGRRQSRVLVRSRAVDGLRIEYNHIGEVAVLEAAALRDSKTVRRLVRDFMNRFRKREPSAFTAYFTQ